MLRVFNQISRVEVGGFYFDSGINHAFVGEIGGLKFNDFSVLDAVVKGGGRGSIVGGAKLVGSDL